MNDLQDSAARVARWGGDRALPGATDLNREAVLQIEARQRFDVNAHVVRAADAMLGTLIDTFA
ncbi:MAG TPA: hypothetical protein PKJ45_14090 [Rubrivivax sp.]|nr:hypothetical protein [Burkholderiales bacterium]HNU12472.1 hypothetical protein [Rubrivivax sp.]